MTQNINVPLSDRAYRRIKRWAETRQQDVGDAIAEFLAENLPDDLNTIPPSTADAKVDQEKAAYLTLYDHPARKPIPLKGGMNGGCEAQW